MDLIRAAEDVPRLTAGWRREGDVGLVPTMGSLHAGHTSLIRGAQEEARRVLVTIFVNPAQFGPGEDLAAYPRDEAADLEICARLGVDAVWVPPVEEVYPDGVLLPEPDPGPVGDTFEGAARPGHFRGVLKVVHRLLDLTGPCRAVFGVKDAQQLFLVRRMVREEGLPVTIVPVPTVRESDGLACSSRNARLAPEERAQAGCLFLALSEAAGLARAGERQTTVLVAAMAREIGATPMARLDYVAVVGDDTFEAITRVDGPARALVAARFPSARLIDNLLLPAPAGAR
ncbi:MAG TPA: pantoate--beta-alanine ligase [Actinomycetota bacterium]|nr:pantoate--beta-alanine ligase [Actinomycetota bacterium]